MNCFHAHASRPSHPAGIHRWRILLVAAAFATCPGCASLFVPGDMVYVRFEGLPPDVSTCFLVAETPEGLRQMEFYGNIETWFLAANPGVYTPTGGEPSCWAPVQWRKWSRYGVVTRGWFREWNLRWIEARAIFGEGDTEPSAADWVLVDLVKAGPPRPLSDAELHALSIAWGQRSVEWTRYGSGSRRPPESWRLQVHGSEAYLDEALKSLSQRDFLRSRKSIESIMWLADELCAPAARGMRLQRQAIEAVYAAYRDFESAAKAEQAEPAAKAIGRMRAAFESLRPTDDEIAVYDHLETASVALKDAEFAAARARFAKMLEDAAPLRRVVEGIRAAPGGTNKPTGRALDEIERHLRALDAAAQAEDEAAAAAAIREMRRLFESMRPK